MKQRGIADAAFRTNENPTPNQRRRGPQQVHSTLLYRSIDRPQCAVNGRSSSREFVVLGVIMIVHFLVHIDSPQQARCGFHTGT